MANNEGVDIIIKAQDQYTKTINNITASNELFGKSVKNNERELAALEKYMIALRVNGLEPTDAAMVKLKNDYDKLSQSLNSGQGALKSSSKQWTSLALIVQDLPYGFRGIQNNLPALFGSMVTGAGAAYFAFSAVVAAITAWDMGLFKVFETTKKVTDAQDDYNKALNSAITSGYGEISQVKALVSVVNNQTLSIDQRRTALKKLQEEYPGYFKNMSLEKTSVDGLTLSVGELTKAIIARAEATAMTSEIEKIAAQRYNNTKAIEKNELAITNLKNSLVLLSKESGYVSGGFGADAKKLTSPYTKALIEIQKLENANKDLISSNEALQNSMSLLQNSVNFRTGISAGLDTNAPKGGKSQEQLAKDSAQKLAKAQDVQISNFIDTLDEKNKEIVKSELKLQEDLATLNAAGFTNYENAFLANRLRIEAINKKYTDKELSEAQKVADKIASIQLDMRFKMESALANINEQFAKEDIKNVDDKLRATLRATRGNYQAQKAAIEGAIADNERFKKSALEAGYGTDEFDKAIVNLKAQLEGLVDPIEQLEINFNAAINSLATGALIELGTQLGNLFSGAGFSIDGILGMFASSLIQLGTYLVTVSKLFVAIKALFASGGLLAPFAIPIGIAAIAAGVALQNSLSKKSQPTPFANGGIISGPTMGLMGEYPGAASNPEVVAPLDKLQSLIGNSGGTLEARISGNDLLILMNKANRNNQNTF